MKRDEKDQLWRDTRSDGAHQTTNGRVAWCRDMWDMKKREMAEDGTSGLKMGEGDEERSLCVAEGGRGMFCLM